MQNNYKYGQEDTGPKHIAVKLCMLEIIFNAQQMV